MCTSLASSLSSKARKASSGGLVTWDWYLATRRISAVVEASGVWPVDEKPGWIGRIHRRADVVLGYGLRSQQAAVVRGVVLGGRSQIPEDLEVAFQRSGIAQVLPSTRTTSREEHFTQNQGEAEVLTGGRVCAREAALARPSQLTKRSYCIPN